MFEYGICNSADESVFERQCAAIERTLIGVDKQEELVDVDESRVQAYVYEGSRVVVILSYSENEVFIRSEVDLEQFDWKHERDLA